MKEIRGLTDDRERALYGLRDARVVDCRFAGEADGESALKEARNIEVSACDFRLRYPLWHVEDFTLSGSEFADTARAAIWYAKRGTVRGCRFGGVKPFRECEDITLEDCEVGTAEVGWRCRGVRMLGCRAVSDYFLFECRDVDIARLDMKGKYSFQYMENALIVDSVLDTKDAFWHARNVTVKNCVIRGEYLGWYSDGLTLVGCRIIGTQPLCYCRNLRLVDCETEAADLAFEYSDVDAVIRGGVDSVKNPGSGKIVADSIGKVILTEDAIKKSTCEIIVGG